MKKIAFFDFDGTITSKDTLLELIKFQKGKAAFYAGVFINAPYVLALLAKFISNQRAKEKVLAYFFKGMTQEAFQTACDKFSSAKLPAMIRKASVLEIKQLQKSGFEVVIVSASAENWIKKWADMAGANLLASKLEAIDGSITGKISGKNCSGEEKVSRIKAAYDLSQYSEIHAYGDSKSDLPMLKLATRSFYRPFRKKTASF